ncbi:MAG: transcriptional repressor LexA [Candidatus Omnitrophica bacterium]|nr:transcriptional repressor LexA [Candidatus Omnitrophota bacterium]
MKQIGSTQKHILELIKDFSAAEGYPPTVRDIAKVLKLAVSTVHEHLAKLREKGLLRHEAGRSRGVWFSGRREAVELPIVGQIAAGRPILAVEEKRDWVPLPKDLVGGGDFIIQVKGDSMTGEGIHDGDHVVIRQQETAADGDIVAALIDEEVTLKTIYKKKDYVILKAANPKYDDLKYPSIKIIGKLVGLFRKY